MSQPNTEAFTGKLHRATPFLATNDMDATIAFYTRVLGFEIKAQEPEGRPTFVLMDNGDASIIFDSTLWSGSPRMSGQVHFDFGEPRSGESAVLTLFNRVKSEAEVLWGPEVYSYGRREFSCSDPNGYALVFSEETDDSAICPGDSVVT